MAKKIDQATFQANGFTLLEVMIALTIFTWFITAFHTEQGFNLVKSTRMRSDIVLKTLCQEKMNEILLDPPDYQESLTLKAETGKFKRNELYKWSVKYSKIIIPNFEQIMGGDQAESGQENSSSKIIFDKVKKNLEKLIWQVEVTVKNSETEEEFTLSHWPYNYNARVNLR